MCFPQSSKGRSCTTLYFCSPTPAALKTSSHRAYFKRTAKQTICAVFFSLTTHSLCLGHPQRPDGGSTSPFLLITFEEGVALKSSSFVLLALVGSGQPPCGRHRNRFWHQWKRRIKRALHLPGRYWCARYETQEWERKQAQRFRKRSWQEVLEPEPVSILPSTSRGSYGKAILPV